MSAVILPAETFTDCTEHVGCPIHGADCPLHNLCQVEVGTGRHLAAKRITGPRIEDRPHDHPHEHPQEAREPWRPLYWAVGAGAVAGALTDVLIRLVT